MHRGVTDSSVAQLSFGLEGDRAGPTLLKPGALVLPQFAREQAPALLQAIEAIAAQSPFRTMFTPGGKAMSVALTNCGALGWVTDRRGYRYQGTDPASGAPWPPMPELFQKFAHDAAAAAGYDHFRPDAGLLNLYTPGAKMTLHQDRDERSYEHPIVSLSLGLSATFLFGGEARSDRPLKVALHHGDVVVFGGPARLCFHGVLPVPDGEHPRVGRRRLNLTLRKAG